MSTTQDASPINGPVPPGHQVVRQRTVQLEEPMTPNGSPAAPHAHPPVSRTTTRMSRRGSQSSAVSSGRNREVMPGFWASLGTSFKIAWKTFKGNLRRKRLEAGAGPTYGSGIRTIVLGSWLNLLLLCIPVSWATHIVWSHPNTTQDIIIFVFSFLAIVPLAQLLSFATDELSKRVGETLAGLINATFGNAVELIVAIIALTKCELQIVQSSLVGSVLSNLLLVLGMCFFVGGSRYTEQGFSLSNSQLNSSLLTVSVIAVLLPAAFHFAAGDQIPDPKEGRDILALSHGAAIILLFIYVCFLIYQLATHSKPMAQVKEEKIGSTPYEHSATDTIKATSHQLSGKMKTAWHRGARPIMKKQSTISMEEGRANGSVAVEADGNHPEPEHGDAAQCASSDETVAQDGDSHTLIARNKEATNGEPAEIVEDDAEAPLLNVPTIVCLIIVVTILVAFTAEFLVDSINGIADTGNISKEFIGLILLPIVGNAAEHVTAVTSSYKDKLDLAIGVAVGSSIQIALFVIPFIVTLGWWIGKPLTLLFDPFESIVMFLAVLVVNYTVADGKSNWLEGMILMCLYFILAVTFWYYPGVNISQQLAQC